jgi:hypothetical protein
LKLGKENLEGNLIRIKDWYTIFTQNSNVIDKILKYCTKEIKSEILSFRMELLQIEQQKLNKEL